MFVFLLFLHKKKNNGKLFSNSVKKTLSLSDKENREIETDFMINHLRLWANKFDSNGNDVIIPGGFEKYGFVVGQYRLGTIFQFLTNMIK